MCPIMHTIEKLDLLKTLQRDMKVFSLLWACVRSQAEKSAVVCCMAVCLTGIAGNLGTVLGRSFQGKKERVHHGGKNRKEYSGPTCLRGQRKQSILGKAEWVGGLQVGQGSGFGRHRDVAR